MTKLRRPAGTHATSRRGIERYRRHGRTSHPIPQTPGARRRAIRKMQVTGAFETALARWQKAAA